MFYTIVLILVAVVVIAYLSVNSYRQAYKELLDEAMAEQDRHEKRLALELEESEILKREAKRIADRQYSKL